MMRAFRSVTREGIIGATFMACRRSGRDRQTYFRRLCLWLGYLHVCARVYRDTYRTRLTVVRNVCPTNSGIMGKLSAHVWSHAQRTPREGQCILYCTGTWYALGMLLII